MVWPWWVLLGSVAALMLAAPRLRHAVQGFNMQYFLYTRTPIGRLYHSKQLDKAALAPAHSALKRTAFDDFTVYTVPFLADNYAHIVVDRASGEAAVVDPADPAAVERALASVRAADGGGGAITLTAILTTHDHMDHAGGNAALAKAYPRLRVYGGADDDVACCTHPLRAGKDGPPTISVGRLTVNVLFAPCHTRGHVLYHSKSPCVSCVYALVCSRGLCVRDTTVRDSREGGALFSGDTSAWRCLQNLPHPCGVVSNDLMARNVLSRGAHTTLTTKWAGCMRSICGRRWKVF